MSVVGGTVRSVGKTVSRAATVTTEAAGAVGGAAVNGVVGGVTGAAQGIKRGVSAGSHSTPAAALAIGALGVAGLVEWPVLLAVGGGALLLRRMSQKPEAPARRRTSNRYPANRRQKKPHHRSPHTNRPPRRRPAGGRAPPSCAAQTDQRCYLLTIGTSIRHMPLRAFAAGFQVTTALASASVSTAANVAGTLGKSAASVAKVGIGTGVNVATIPLREGAKALSGEMSRETLSRNCWRNESRAWIEVRGLDGDDDDELGRVVLDAIRALPGVTSASLNHPLSRAVVDIDDPGLSLRDLCRAVEDAEKRCGREVSGKDESVFARSLPGDGVVLATRALTVVVNAAGLGVALTGRALGLRPLPAAVAASVAFVDYQPWLRRLLADRIGGPTTDTVLTLAAAAAQTLTQSPTSLALGLTDAVDESRRSPRARRKAGRSTNRSWRDTPTSRVCTQTERYRGRSRRDPWSGRRVVSRCCKRSAPGRSVPAPATWPWPPRRCR